MLPWQYLLAIFVVFVANTNTKKRTQCRSAGMDFGKTTTASDMDGTEYAVYVTTSGWRVRIQNRKNSNNELHVVMLIDHFTGVAVLPGLWLEARLPVTLF